MLSASKKYFIYIFTVFFCITAYAEDASPRMRQVDIVAKIEITQQKTKEASETSIVTVNLTATENTQALIEKGVEMALQGMPAVNQAAGNEFRSALLRLHVLPRITEAGHILLEFELQLDEPMQDDYIMFLKRRINSSNLIRNQNTALVGRVYEEKGEETLEIKIYITPTILEQPL